MLYQQGKLTKSEAEYLLSFTNQFSPAYLISFVLDMIFIPNGITLSIIQLFALFYGIPLLYGLIIRYTHYYKSINKRIVIASHRKMKYNDSDHSHQNVLSKSKSKNRISSLQYIPDSISDSICQIGMLGGYMIACSSLRIIPALLLKKVRFLSLFIESSLEISSGLNNLAAHINEPRRLLLTASANLSFGGICCLFQTLSLLSETDLSSQKYMLHKAILCSITVIAIWILYF